MNNIFAGKLFLHKLYQNDTASQLFSSHCLYTKSCKNKLGEFFYCII